MEIQAAEKAVQDGIDKCRQGWYYDPNSSEWVDRCVRDHIYAAVYITTSKYKAVFFGPCNHVPDSEYFSSQQEAMEYAEMILVLEGEGE